MMRNKMTRQLTAPALGLVFTLGASGSALAHAAPMDAGLLAGLLHPLSGLDHLLVMLGVGIWAATQARRSDRLALPLVFLLFMAGGAAVAVSGLSLPLLETGIALSVVLMGILLIKGAILPLAGAASLAAVFALLHGNAHGLALVDTSAMGAYFAGFLLATLALNAIGMLLGRQLLARQWVIRLLGLATGAAGSALMLAGA